MNTHSLLIFDGKIVVSQIILRAFLQFGKCMNRVYLRTAIKNEIYLSQVRM